MEHNNNARFPSIPFDSIRFDSIRFGRYQNVKSELEAQQKLERIRAERQSSSMGRVSVPAVHKKATGKHSATRVGARGVRRNSKQHGAWPLCAH